MYPLGGLYIQVPLYINYHNVSLGWSLYTGSTVHQLPQCIPWVVFVYRFHCTSTTTLCSLGGLCIQVPLYINYYTVSLGWSLYTGSTVHQLLHCVPWVVFVYRFHCTSTTTMYPLGGLYIQVPLYINYHNVSLGWSLYTGSTVHVQYVPIVVLCIVCMLTYTRACIHTHNVHTIHYVYICRLVGEVVYQLYISRPSRFLFSSLKNSGHVPPLKELASQWEHPPFYSQPCT